MSKHTPGPWRVEAHYSGPATMAQMRNPERLLCVNADASAKPPGWQATDANARLIAAAPRMYEFIEQVARCRIRDTPPYEEATAILEEIDGRS